MAVRNKGDGGQPVRADSENEGMVDRPPVVREKVSGDLRKANGKGDVGACTGHVEGLTNAGTAGEEHIPNIMQITDFEEQLNDIDRAINFGEKNTEGVTKSKERNDLKAESQEHNLNALSWGGDEVNKVEAAEFGTRREMGLGPGVLTENPREVGTVSLGFPRNSQMEAKPFTIGLASPRREKTCRQKKDQSGHNKKMKPIREKLGKENRDRMDGSLKGDGQQLDVTEVVMEAFEAGEKCKEHIPMMDLSPLSENNKKQKVENEVQVLGQIMAQQLGSAVAAWQHRRDQ